MTVEKCAAACSSFTSFGLEYGRECYCGNVRNDGSVSAPESECSFECPGDSSQKCGAGNRLDVYTRPADDPVPTRQYTAKGCQSEPQNTRALTGKSFNDDAMTVEKCAAGCAGYSYFGLEYYHECYCGNAISAGSSGLTNGECKFPCAGDSAQTCGGDWALNLYAFDAPSGTTTSVSTTPTAPANAQFTADGCWTDSTSDRVLAGAVFYDDLMTIGKCQAICSTFQVFGVEYGRECYCGNSLKDSSTQRDTAECSFACPGNPSQKCGAGDRLNVYRKSVVIATSSTTQAIVSTTSSMTSSVTSSTVRALHVRL